MKLALNTSGPGVTFGLYGAGMAPTLNVVQLAEHLGFDSVWTAEASGTDAVVPLSWIAGATDRIKLGTSVMQMTAREPSTTAMTAVTLDNLSGGRFILGLGSSSPGVVEGWHSRHYGDPLQRTREYVSIVRRLMTTRKPVAFHGEYYDLPLRKEGHLNTVPVKLAVRAKRRRIPIYLAGMGPKNLKLATEIADGVLFPFYTPFRDEITFGPLRDKFGEGKVEVGAYVPVAIGPSLNACLEILRPVVTFFVGGMGSNKVNYYNNFVRRLGYGEAAAAVQYYYLRGQRNAAAAAVPAELIDELCLCGSPARIAERLEVWKQSALTTLILTGALPDAMELLAELVDSQPRPRPEAVPGPPSEPGLVAGRKPAFAGVSRIRETLV